MKKVAVPVIIANTIRFCSKTDFGLIWNYTGSDPEQTSKVCFLKLESTGTSLISKAQRDLFQKRTPVPIPNYTRLDPEPGGDAENFI
jgi:hypothetical protein